MTRLILAGGGTAGHVNPLLSVADELVRVGMAKTEDILVLGTAEGLEARLVPEAGYRLVTTARLPFPRRFGLDAVIFWPRLAGSVLRVIVYLRRHKAQALVGFGGYASAPGYLAAWLCGIPFVIHEANAVPGFANRLGSRLTRHVAVAFSRTRLPHARVIGMPMPRAITHPSTALTASKARTSFGLKARSKTLLVTGGSQGAVLINETMSEVVEELLAMGWQILHIVGSKNPVPKNPPAGYVALPYCNDMDRAFAAATAVISRAGAATVSEIQLLGLPAIFVPYPVGNGEQEKNASDSLGAGAAVLVADRDFTPDYVRQTVLPLLGDEAALQRMRDNAKGLGRPNAAKEFVDIIASALHKDRRFG
jgi:UDP-N-acetylglucosamine--N-acetylmuramyl-(pentapeptide) pyrophosphoryl-undecaprenol N-acetylglucosamine transferase